MLLSAFNLMPTCVDNNELHICCHYKHFRQTVALKQIFNASSCQRLLDGLEPIQADFRREVHPEQTDNSHSQTKKKLSCKRKLSILQSIYVPTLTYGNKLWTMTERTRYRRPKSVFFAEWLGTTLEIR